LVDLRYSSHLEIKLKRRRPPEVKILVKIYMARKNNVVAGRRYSLMILPPDLWISD